MLSLQAVLTNPMTFGCIPHTDPTVSRHCPSETQPPGTVDRPACVHWCRCSDRRLMGIQLSKMQYRQLSRQFKTFSKILSA